MYERNRKSYAPGNGNNSNKAINDNPYSSDFMNTTPVNNDFKNLSF